MAEHIRHVDDHFEDMKNILDTAFGDALAKADEQQFCFDCMTRLLLEMAGFVAMSGGFSMDEIIDAVSEGADASLEENDDDDDDADIYGTSTTIN